MIDHFSKGVEVILELIITGISGEPSYEQLPQGLLLGVTVLLKEKIGLE